MIIYITAILVSLIISVLLALVVLPLVIRLDTATDEYYVKIKGLASFRLSSDSETNELYFLFRMPFFSKVIYPFQAIGKRKEKDRNAGREDRPGEVKRKKKGRSMTPGKLLKMVSTFRVHDFRCTFDTGDFVRNAWLVPVLQVMTRYRNNLSVNFTGDFQLRFAASSNLWRIGKAYLTG